MPDAAIGFRARSGWGTLIAVTGGRDAPVVLQRSRIDLIDDLTFAQPYHAAEGQPFARAEALIRRCRETSCRLAGQAVADSIASLRRSAHRAVACGLLLASGRPLPALEQILASHALIHTAEGELFRDAFRDAARAARLPLIEVRERDLSARAAGALNLPAAAIDAAIAEAGRALGPPWRQDEKLATLAAWLALFAE